MPLFRPHLGQSKRSNQPSEAGLCTCRLIARFRLSVRRAHAEKEGRPAVTAPATTYTVASGLAALCMA
jgi:hypothetical protein